MAIYLEILEGELKGKRFPIQDGYKLGRTTGEIIVPDKKISSLHAQIEYQENKFVLVDRNSSNGIIIADQRVKSLVLTPGIKFTVGRTQFTVLELDEDVLFTTAGEKDLNENAWVNVLQKEVPKLPTQNNLGIALNIFNPLIQLDCIQGPETDRQILLGFGPRKFGSRVLDIELRDRTCPFFAFEILPLENNAKIKTNEIDFVKLNGVNFSEEILKSGDKISFGETVFLVSFIYDEETRLR